MPLRHEKVKGKRVRQMPALLIPQQITHRCLPNKGCGSYEMHELSVKTKVHSAFINTLSTPNAHGSKSGFQRSKTLAVTTVWPFSLLHTPGHFPTPCAWSPCQVRTRPCNHRGFFYLSSWTARFAPMQLHILFSQRIFTARAASELCKSAQNWQM